MYYRQLYSGLKLRHPRCVCNNEVRDNVGQNTTSLLAGCSYGVNEATCFGLLGACAWLLSSIPGFHFIFIGPYTVGCTIKANFSSIKIRFYCRSGTVVYEQA